MIREMIILRVVRFVRWMLIFGGLIGDGKKMERQDGETG